VLAGQAYLAGRLAAVGTHHTGKAFDPGGIVERLPHLAAVMRNMTRYAVVPSARSLG